MAAGRHLLRGVQPPEGGRHRAGDAAKVSRNLGDGGYNTHEYTGQRTRIVVDGLQGDTYLDYAYFGLGRVSAHAGYADNKAWPTGANFGNDDFSFAAAVDNPGVVVTSAAPSENAPGQLLNGRAYSELWVKDYGARGGVVVLIGKEGQNTMHAAVSFQLPVDVDRDDLADPWELRQVRAWNARYGASEAETLAFFGREDDKEPRDPGGAGEEYRAKMEGRGHGGLLPVLDQITDIENRGIANPKPWYFRPTGARLKDDPIPPDGEITLQVTDTPQLPIWPTMLDDGFAANATMIVDFDVYLVARTTADGLDAPKVWTQAARAQWQFDGGGTVAAGAYMPRPAQGERLAAGVRRVANFTAVAGAGLVWDVRTANDGFRRARNFWERF